MKKYLLPILLIKFWSCEEILESIEKSVSLEWIQFQTDDYDPSCLGGSVASGCFYYTDSVAIDPDDYEYWDYYYYGDTSWVEGNDTVYYVYLDSALVLNVSSYHLNSSQDNFPAYSKLYSCNYINYYVDESYFEYELTSENELRSLDVSGFSDISFKLK